MKIKKTLLTLPLIGLGVLSSGCNNKVTFNAQTALKKILDRNITLKGEVLIDRDESSEKVTYAKFEIREQAVTSTTATEQGNVTWVKYTEKENPTKDEDYEHALYYDVNRMPIGQMVAIPTAGSKIVAAGVPNTFDPFTGYEGILSQFIPKQYYIYNLVSGFLNAAYHSPFNSSTNSCTILNSDLSIKKTAIFKVTPNGADISKFAATMNFNDKDVEVLRVNEITYGTPSFSGMPSYTYHVTDVKALKYFKKDQAILDDQKIVEIQAKKGDVIELVSEIKRFDETTNDYTFNTVTPYTDALTSNFEFNSKDNKVTVKTDAKTGDCGYIFCECGGIFSNLVKIIVSE